MIKESVGAKHSDKNIGEKSIINHPNADASSTLRERPYRSQEIKECQ
ncbi:hypothetical protein H5968_23185 [Sphaerospermopsis sp. LEGE 00249]|nr:hypothetical protein [Sphaerospermopsis sp. LEGE 00249]